MITKLCSIIKDYHNLEKLIDFALSKKLKINHKNIIIFLVKLVSKVFH